MTQIIHHKGHKLLAMNGMPDHVHLFIGMKADMSVSDLIRDVKRSSTAFVRESGYCGSFQWQEGFGAFSYSQSEVTHVIQYIWDQKLHHKSTDYKEEYLKMLKDFQVEFDERYVF